MSCSDHKFAIVLLAVCSASGTASAEQAPVDATNAGTTAPATAAEPATSADIVVTAQRRAEKLQDIPAAVSAVGATELKERNIKTVADALRAAPGLNISSPYGEAGAPNITIRGVTSTDFSQNQSKPIATYLDEGVKNFQLFEAMPLFDVERVEILNGPQGTLYGKNASGGAINIITKQPGFVNEGYLTLGYGNFNRRSAQGAVQANLIDEKLRGRPKKKVGNIRDM
jgi:iron complex outermembrane receptor protein